MAALRVKLSTVGYVGLTLSPLYLQQNSSCRLQHGRPGGDIQCSGSRPCRCSYCSCVHCTTTTAAPTTRCTTTTSHPTARRATRGSIRGPDHAATRNIASCVRHVERCCRCSLAKMAASERALHYTDVCEYSPFLLLANRKEVQKGRSGKILFIKIPLV